MQNIKIAVCHRSFRTKNGEGRKNVLKRMEGRPISTANRPASFERERERETIDAVTGRSIWVLRRYGWQT